MPYFHRTIPGDLTKGYHGANSRLNELPQGIGEESDSSATVVQKAIGPSGGHVVNINEDLRKYNATQNFARFSGYYCK